MNGLFTFNVQAEVNNLMLSTLTVEDGLSQGTVNSTVQDSSGLMWIGTDAGLNIYDGYTFKLLQGPEGSLDSLAIQVFMQDEEGLLWFNVFDQGIYTYNLTTNQYHLVISVTDLGKNNYISYAFEDHDETVWISTSKYLYRYDKSTQSANVVADLSAELEDNNEILQLSDHNDYIFIATHVGIFVYHKHQGKWLKLPSTAISSNPKMAADEEKVYTINAHGNDLFIGTFVSILGLDISNVDNFFNQKATLPDYIRLAEGISTWQLLEHKDQIYVASNQGLSVINQPQQKLDYLFGFSDVNDGVSDNTIRSVYVDNNGLFWLGTATSGIYQWKPSTELITNYRYKKDATNSLSFNEVWGVLPHKQRKSHFWVATANGLNLIDHQNKMVESYLVSNDTKEIYNASHIFQMEYYDDHTLILATYEGVSFFDTETNTLTNKSYSKKISDLFTGEYIMFHLDDKANIWLATEQDIYVISIENNTATSVFNIRTDPNYLHVNQSISNLLGFLPDKQTLLFSNSDSLWSLDIKSYEASLLYLNPKSKLAEWAYIDNWFIDKNNIFWLTFIGKGLIGLSLPDFKPKYHFTNANSIMNNSIYGIQGDVEGGLWFSSNDGIFFMDADSHHMRNFNTKHGFNNNEFNGGAWATLPSNHFVYGGMSGVSVFDPLKLKKLQDNEDFSVTITNVSALSRDLNLPLILNPETPVELDYDDIGIRIDFSTLIFGNNERIRYEYKLRGNENVQYPLTYDNSITFPFLSSGKHVLEIRAESPVSGVFSNPTTIIFKVSYAPWASPIAYLMYFMIGSYFVGVWIHKRQKQRVELLNAHEEVKFRENRLQLALTGSNSEVWDWQAQNNLVFGKRAVEDLGFEHFTDFYPFKEHVALIHPKDKEDFLSRWQLFLHSESHQESFICTYRLQNKNGEWLWYKDLGKVVEYTESGEPMRVTGSYTNITDTKASEERALYYGDAFKQTKDWVFIISENFTRVTANKSLCEVFGWENEEFEFNDRLFGVSRTKREEYKSVLSKLKQGMHFKSEELVFTDNGDEYHVIVNITASRNEANNQLHYICVFSDITAQKMAEQELRYLANYDHLTNLPNRSLLLERINHAMDYSKRKNRSIALFFIDLDRFKKINDSLGHDCGDLLLKEITLRLTKALRMEDTLARIGGDEFVVLLEDFKGNSQLAHIAQDLIAEVGKPVILKGNEVSVGASIGIALYPDDAKNSDELLRNADVAMYHSKQLGRNTFQFFTQRMNYEANVRLQVEFNLKQALSNEEFINYYQPIVDLSTEKAIGFELLLRWQSYEKLVSPITFIPIAEELGLIVEMTEHAIERGLRDLSTWRKTNEELFLSVNLSPLHFAKDSLVPFIKKQLMKHDLPASALKLEVTESVLISEPEKAIKIMNMLSALGILLALDDFGTGYSSLSYLKQLPLQIIKIDRSFVSGINVNSADEAIVDATIVLAKRLNMKCIAEGVESQEQLDYLAALNCNHIQGYFYSRPLNLEQLTEYLAKNNN